MVKIKIYGGNKKPRTMLRFIKIGDIFCFEYDGTNYAFGQIIGKSISGHVAIFFDLFKNIPEITEQELSDLTCIGEPKIIDSYSLFDRKSEGNWQIIGHEENINLIPYEKVYFKYGDPNGSKFGKVDITGKVYPKEYSFEESQSWQWDSPKGDISIKEILSSYKSIVGTLDIIK